MATDTEEFRVGSILGPEGTGGNGQVLLEAHALVNTPELRAVQLRRINPVLDGEIDDKFLEKVCKIAGVDELADVHVRGGDKDGRGAFVTYARVDDGVVTKGFVPYDDVAKGSGKGHFSQREVLLDSDFAKERPRPTATSATQEPVDPFAALAGASAEDLVALMREHPERVDAIKAFESATRGEKARKTVLDFTPDEPKGDGSGD